MFDISNLFPILRHFCSRAFEGFSILCRLCTFPIHRSCRRFGKHFSRVELRYRIHRRLTDQRNLSWIPTEVKYRRTDSQMSCHCCVVSPGKSLKIDCILTQIQVSTTTLFSLAHDFFSSAICSLAFDIASAGNI